ncbi:MAG: Rpn family recombination-promoting nuclease/putative transposase [Bacteroidales bacterium]|nr:Rpn family recombination-promoting nuclease/putative transposase [Bacteroidales bacterium]
MLPFHEGKEIEELEFLPAELAPDSPMKKNTIVDVRCKDNQGRQFIVEMQMFWTPSFMQHVLFNTSKAYVRQLDRSFDFKYLQPVYSLSLINDIFMPDLKDFYHHYDIVNIEHTEKVIEGLHFVFVELPKFKPQSISERRMAVLWLRFLTEMNAGTDSVPKEFLENPYLREAVRLLETSSYNESQLYNYEKFWDAVASERVMVTDAMRKGKMEGLEEGKKQGLEEGKIQGLEEGKKQGLEEGKKQGLEEGKKQGLEEGKIQGLEEGKIQGARENAISIARNLKRLGLPDNEIAQATGLLIEEVEKVGGELI